MVMATQMLPLGPPVGNRSAVLHILARQNAVEAIKGRLQAQGIRLTNVPFRTIRVFAAKRAKINHFDGANIRCINDRRIRKSIDHRSEPRDATDGPYSKPGLVV
jgi:hypothetical protein